MMTKPSRPARRRKLDADTRTLQRWLRAAAAIGATLVALCGIAAAAWPPRQSSVGLAVALTVGLLASGCAFVCGLAARARMERSTRDLQAIEIHPYRTASDDDRPVGRGVQTSDRPSGPSWVARASAGAALLFVVVVLVVVASGDAGALGKHRWTFLGDANTPDVLGFEPSPLRGGAWAVEDDHAATGARSLVNRAGDDSGLPATLVATSVRARDVRALTRCRVRRELAGGACGLVFRFVDEANHHVAMIDAGSARVVLATVSDGNEHVLGTARALVQPGIWQELSLEARGDSIRVFLNGELVIDDRDVMPARIGTVGLWAPAATEAYFDELAIEPLVASPQALEMLPLLKKQPS